MNTQHTERDWLVKPPSHISHASRIIHAVAQAHHIRPEEITGPTRPRHIVDARREVAKQLRALDWSFPRIARVFNFKCHTSVMNLLKPKSARVAAKREASQ